jgi:hypothetical protein
MPVTVRIKNTHIGNIVVVNNTNDNPTASIPKDICRLSILQTS